MNDQKAIKKFHDACNLLASRINEKLFKNSLKWYWVADEVGGVCDFGDGDFLSPKEMVLILDNNLTYEQYEEWMWANVYNHEDKGYINLKSWIRGLRYDSIMPIVKNGVWIDCKDELPPYDESVLCCSIADPEDMFFCHRSDNPEVQVDSNGWCHYQDGNITHWMRVRQISQGIIGRIENE